MSRQPSPGQVMIDQKQLENVEYFGYVGSMITNEARCTREIKSRIAMTKAALNKNILFTRKLDLDTTEGRSEILGKFWNVVLEKDGEDQLDRSCEK
jgi:hypothetical protein